MCETNLADHGFVLARDVFMASETSLTTQAILERAQMTLSEFESGGDGLAASFYRHGVVAETPNLWPLLVHQGVVTAVREAVGANCKCLVGIDTVGVHYSESEPHRDVSAAQLPSLA